MKTLFFILLFILFGSINLAAQTTETAKPPETKKETVSEPPQKVETTEVKPVTPNNPDMSKAARPKHGAKPEVVRPDRRRPAGAGRPAGVRRPPVRRLR